MAKPKPEQQPASAPGDAAAGATDTAGGGAGGQLPPAGTGAGSGSPAPGTDPMTPAELAEALGIDQAEVFGLNLATRTIVTRDGQKHRLG